MLRSFKNTRMWNFSHVHSLAFGERFNYYLRNTTFDKFVFLSKKKNNNNKKLELSSLLFLVKVINNMYTFLTALGASTVTKVISNRARQEG